MLKIASVDLFPSGNGIVPKLRLLLGADLSKFPNLFEIKGGYSSWGGAPNQRNSHMPADGNTNISALVLSSTSGCAVH
ncbi:MAG: hypothetical protein JRJ60_09020 [Deltaproteobacteria bacterium]|nr:hypothetical protein [Deltaproteobacteria bacterium]